MHIDDILRASLEDTRFSRQEKRDLKAWLAERPLDGNALARYRSRAFAIAREVDTGEPWLLKWLERVLKVLTDRDEATSTRAYFSPGDACRDAIAEQLHDARQTVDICVFTITDDRISDKILAAHRRGVKVRIITDNDKAEDLGADIARLERAGIPVREDHTRHHMHHKFAIFDGAALVTGSYNWTRSASEHNQENIIVSHEASLIAQFHREFERLWRSL